MAGKRRILLFANAGRVIYLFPKSFLEKFIPFQIRAIGDRRLWGCQPPTSGVAWPRRSPITVNQWEVSPSTKNNQVFIAQVCSCFFFCWITIYEALEGKASLFFYLSLSLSPFSHFLFLSCCSPALSSHLLVGSREILFAVVGFTHHPNTSWNKPQCLVFHFFSPFNLAETILPFHHVNWCRPL